MASSYQNLLTVEQPWDSRPEILGGFWFSDAFTKESDAIIKSLQSSLYGVAAEDSSYSCDLSNNYVLSDELLESVLAKAVKTPSASFGSANELGASAAVSKKRQRSAPSPYGKTAKRKSRAKKKTSTTTFITADPANFREMVQQVTGARFAAAHDAHPAPPPEAVNLHSRLPTLDTSSAFLINRSSAEHYTDSYSNFPTLESSAVETMLKPCGSGNH